jgi:hypothetical protein
MQEYNTPKRRSFVFAPAWRSMFWLSWMVITGD